MKTLLILAALGAASAPALAQRTQADRGAIVRHGDLDLASEAGIRALDRRIRHAASSACGTASPADPAGKRNLKRCRSEARASAREQHETAVAAARRTNRNRLASRP
jgi:UrcA family protein